MWCWCTDKVIPTNLRTYLHPALGAFHDPASTFMPSVMPYLFSSHYVLVITLGNLLFRNKPKRKNTDSSGSNENAATSIKLCLIPTMGKQSPLLNPPACLFDLGHAHPNEPLLSHVQVHLHVPSSPLAHCQSLLWSIKSSVCSILVAILIQLVFDEQSY